MCNFIVLAIVLVSVPDAALRPRSNLFHVSKQIQSSVVGMERNFVCEHRYYQKAQVLSVQTVVSSMVWIHTDGPMTLKLPFLFFGSCSELFGYHWFYPSLMWQSIYLPPFHSSLWGSWLSDWLQTLLWGGWSLTGTKIGSAFKFVSTHQKSLCLLGLESH